VHADQVVAFAGTQNGLYASLTMLVQSGDEVLVPDPYYATYEGAVAATGATFVPVRTAPEDGFHVTAAALEAAVTPRARLVLLNTPSNPTGAVLSTDDVDAIGEVCVRHDLWIVCDEVYADITFGKRFASPFDHPLLRERSFSVASISKSHALPGFRTGWVACPPGLAAPLTVLSETMLFGSQPFLADALAVALDGHHPEVDELRTTFEQRARALVGAFAGARAATARMPEGGMFVLVDVRATGLTGEQFAWRLLDEHGVVVMPGESFGAGGAGQLRIALTVGADVLVEACGKIRSLAESLVVAAR
jgi:arginine:pyruvate transaminase